MKMEGYFLRFRERILLSLTNLAEILSEIQQFLRQSVHRSALVYRFEDIESEIQREQQ